MITIDSLLELVKSETSYYISPMALPEKMLIILSIYTVHNGFIAIGAPNKDDSQAILSHSAPKTGLHLSMMLQG